MKINWSKFDENSSEREAIYDFANGLSLSKLRNLLWSNDAKIEYKKLAKLGTQISRRRAKKWLYNSGYYQ
jgi:5-enolpyruvylshikimate-3-phosphate synthase